MYYILQRFFKDFFFPKAFTSVCLLAISTQTLMCKTVKFPFKMCESILGGFQSFWT